VIIGPTGGLSLQLCEEPAPRPRCG
jgi:hypothetical protein